MMSAVFATSLRRFASRVGLGLLAAVVALGVDVREAHAVSAGPAWAIQSVAMPTSFSLSDNESCEQKEVCDGYLVTVTNVGTRPSAGTIVVKDTLPSNVVVKGVAAEAPEPPPIEHGEEPVCTQSGSSFECTDVNPVRPGYVLAFHVQVTVTSGGSTPIANHAVVEGGGAATATISEPSSVTNTSSGEAPSFGVQDFSVGAYGPNGASDAQAGNHPDALTTTLHYTTEFDRLAERGNHVIHSVQEPKTTIVDLPLGFVGNPLAAGQCPESILHNSGKVEEFRHCPADSQVGIAALDYGRGAVGSLVKVYNIAPEPGYPAMFAFEFAEIIIVLRARVVPTPSGYTLSVSVPDIPRSQLVKVTGLSLTFFGDPAIQDGEFRSPLAFFTNPTNCTAEPLKAKLEMDSWVNPQRWVSKEAAMYEASSTQAVNGCNLLQFNPTFELRPEETQADTPSGYAVDLKVPQVPSLSPALATPELRDAEVRLPEGVVVSPGAADGLVACQEVGPEGINITHGWTPTGAQPLNPADPEAMEIGPDGLPHVAAGKCPHASQIGDVEITTPVLARPLKGHVFVAQPLCGGAGQPSCTDSEAAGGNLFRLYLEAEGSEQLADGQIVSNGVIVKLEGRVAANPTTGQLTTTFKNNPQLPFSDLKLNLTSGARAPLSNPQTCGAFTTTSDLVPWSAPLTPDATPSSPPFVITGCASPMPFSPSFISGSIAPAAASSSPFTLTVSRSDGQQDFSGLTTTLPPGLVGMISQVPLCEEPQASKGDCSEASRIGSTTVAAGSGSHPFWLSGRVYLTGPYNGAPFGLSVVVLAKAGPFNLGNEVVRAAINIDPHTSAVTVTSSPIPQIKDGVPFRLKTINVTIDRPGFMLNPTNCEGQTISGTIAAAQGAKASVSSPFAVGGCASLPFKPSFKVSTQAKTSKAFGASLDVKVTYPNSGQANIKSVKVDLPLALPSRLTTLNKACPVAVFESNPAKCPPESIVGIAKAQTPVLPVTLTGPAYLVSHAAESFPQLVVILQGEGVRVDLFGYTFIKKGITSSNFASIPDVPVSSFELYLPEGHFSALTANGNLCKQKLQMPTKIIGQNGAVIKQTTQIKVTGCPKAKKARKAKKTRRSRKASHTRAGKGRSA